MSNLSRLEKIQHFFDPSMFILICIIAVGTFIDMVLITMDVGGRYLFGNPIDGTLELSQLLLVLIIYMPLAYVEKHGGHLKITLLTSHFPDMQTKIDFISKIMCLCVFGFLTFLTFKGFSESYATRQTSWGAIELPLWIPKFFIFVGCLLYFFQNFLDLGLRLARFTGREK